jgi:transcriptional regulator with XRE-family HTH domain
MFLKKLGYRLKVRRTELGLTQSEVAAQLSKSTAAINKIERGLVNLGVNSLMKYCEVLDIKIETLLREITKEG